MTYFHMAAATLSSAIHGFTTEFGMGSGGSHALLSPSKLVIVYALSNNTKLALLAGNDKNGNKQKIGKSK